MKKELHDTIEVGVFVEYDYQPQEDATERYPGCHEDADIVFVWLEDEDGIKIDISSYLPRETIEGLRRKALKEARDEKCQNQY